MATLNLEFWKYGIRRGYLRECKYRSSILCFSGVVPCSSGPYASAAF